MNSTQFFGILVFSLGILCFVFGIISAPFGGDSFLPLFFLAGAILLGLAPVIILVSLVVERIHDLKNDKKTFSRMEGRK